MIFIRGRTWIDKGNIVEYIVKGMMCPAEDNAIDVLAEKVLRFSGMDGKLLHRANIVGNSQLEAVEILHPRIGQIRQREFKVVAANRQDFPIVPAQRFQHLFAFEVAGVYDHLSIPDQIEHSRRNGIAAYPVRIGEDCNLHGGPPSLLENRRLRQSQIIPPCRKRSRCGRMTEVEVILTPRTGLRLKNPVIAASGTFGYGIECAAKNDISGLGAVICKGTTRQARTGNQPLRLTETAAGMLNAIGLQNIGVDAVVRDKAPLWAALDLPFLVNVSGTTVEDYADIVARLDGVPGVAGIELNISCPNVKEGGVAFGTDSRMAAEVTRAVRDVTDLPLMVKLSPNVSDIRPIASAVEEAGADAISLVNTVYGMAIDARHRRPLMPSVTGGLSGPAIKPLALYLVYQVAQEVSVPIVGLGGILRAEDAIEFLLAGATAVAVGTALMLDPTSWRNVVAGIDQWCRREGVHDLAEITGAANAGYKKRAGEVSLTG